MACMGFTLVELLAVMLLVALLAALVAGVSSSANRTAAESKAHADIENWKYALEEYRLEQGVYPPDLLVNTAEVDISFITNSLERLDGTAVTDPWGREYKYQKNGLQYKLYSQGPLTGDDVDDVY